MNWNLKYWSFVQLILPLSHIRVRLVALLHCCFFKCRVNNASLRLQFCMSLKLTAPRSKRKRRKYLSDSKEATRTFLFVPNITKRCFRKYKSTIVDGFLYKLNHAISRVPPNCAVISVCETFSELNNKMHLLVGKCTVTYRTIIMKLFVHIIRKNPVWVKVSRVCIRRS